jgi:transglutaminase-like putative cysteine protease
MIHPRASARVVVLSLVALALLAAPHRPAAAAEEVLRDEWAVVRMGGARVGWEHVRVRRLSDPVRIETTRESSMSMKRLNATIEITSTETVVEREDGTLISLKSRDKQSSEETLTSIEFDGTKARVRTETMGKAREKEVDVPADMVGPWRVERIPFEAGYPVGETFETKTFMHQFGGPQVVRTTVVGPEEVEVADGSTQKLLRLDMAISYIRGSTWVDEGGSIARAKVSVAGMTVESLRTTKADATGEDDADTVPQVDTFTASLIASPVLIPHARSIEEALVRLRTREDGALPDLASDRQTVEEKGEDSVTLRIRRATPPEGAATRPLADAGADLQRYLHPSSSLQSDEPDIVKVTKEAVGSETDAWKAAQAIERWVAKNLTNKGFGVASATALEVCRQREGDCTEHAVLAAAMSRAAGIPSRVAFGLEYVMGIWGGHAWHEVWIDGKWYALDATNGFGHVDALHLTVATTALEEGTFGEELTSLMGVVGAVDVDVVEAKWKGRTLPVGDPEAVRAEGRSYVNLLYDLSFTAPEGFTVEAMAPKGLGDQLATVRGKTAEGESVEIAVHAADVPADGPPALKGESREVDGRTASAVVRGRQRAVAIVVDDVLFVFTAPDSPAGRRVLDALVATVDLDAAAARAPR